MDLATIISLSVAALSLASTIYAWRRKEEATVRLKELEVERSQIDNTTDHIASADKMVDLIEKTTEKVLAQQGEYYEKIIKQLKTDYGKILNRLLKLEKAIQSISTCAYRSQCPVLERLQDGTASAEQPDRTDSGQRADCRDPTGHDHRDSRG